MGSQATRLLYYEDTYLREFEATVLQVVGNAERMGVILDRTAFYPAGGGQPSDTGVIEGDGGEAEVVDVQWNNGNVLHRVGKVEGTIDAGDPVKGRIDWSRRYSLMRNHTAAHLMTEAIRVVVGRPVKVVGSGLDADKVRLDLAADGSLRPLFGRIEEVANRIVQENRSVRTVIMNREDAEKHVEKFHESLNTLPAEVTQVRIVEVEGVHACACGGTHVSTTGEIGAIELLGRSSKGKGIERLEFRACRAQSP
jgi:alanyl-tRNA synthetase